MAMLDLRSALAVGNPFPLVGEGGAQRRMRGALRLPPHPPRFARHPLPQGERGAPVERREITNGTR
jgi:hypothetical protein